MLLRGQADTSCLMLMSLNDLGGGGKMRKTHIEVMLLWVDVVKGCILIQTTFWTNQTASENFRDTQELISNLKSAICIIPIPMYNGN